MNYVVPTVAGFIATTFKVFCPVVVPFALLFAKWEQSPTNGVVRGDLPKWLSWFSTPDERLPGGMYEPTVAAMYKKHGRFITAWYWLGFRNCLHGFAAMFGKPASDFFPGYNRTDPKFFKRDDIWRYFTYIGPFRFVVGYKVYRLADGSFLATPSFTIQVRDPD